MPGRHYTFPALLAAGLVIAGTAVGGQRHPDLQGYWTNDSYVPLERPDEAKGKEFFTPAEAQAFLKSRVDRLNGQSRTDIHYDDALWQAENYVKQAHMRTSIIYDPPDGRLPPLSDAGRRLEAARAQARKGVGAADNVQARTLAERCIAWGNVGPPMLPPAYNANFQIMQTPDHVVIRHEMMHDVRLIPIGGPAAPGRTVQQQAGISRGRWEGDTFVVETTNFTSKTNFRGSPQSTRQDIFASETMRVVERFRLTGPDTIDYRFTVDDPSVWTRSWSGEAPLRRFEGPIYEYGCHEGNYGVANILRAARVAEANGQAVDSPVPFNRFAPNSVFPRLVLATAAVLFAAFGLAFAVAPHRLAAMVDITLPTNTATIDFVATYGGFEIGFAIFLFYCLMRPERVRLGLLASGWAVAGFAATRAIGLLALGGAKPVMYGALAFEAVCATVAFVAATRPRLPPPG